MKEISYKLEVFEGPLDLLLSLISKHKLNIYDIPVAQLLEQYLEHIELMRSAKMDIASEFLVMASRLVYIKSAQLLPKQEEAEQLKRELQGELIEYQLCREMATKLANLADFDRYSREEMELEVDRTYRIEHDASVLLKAYLTVCGRKKVEEPAVGETFGNIVAKPVVSVTTRVVHILKRLRKGESVGVKQLFYESRSRSEAVATFLAILELVKAGRIDYDDEMNITLIKG